MRTVAAAKRSAKNRPARTITVNVALIETLTEFFRLFSAGADEGADCDVWNSPEADHYRDCNFSVTMHRRLGRMLQAEEIRQAVADALAALPTQPSHLQGPPALELASDDEVRSIAALAALVARRAGALESDRRAGLRWEMLTAAASTYALEPGNVERHQALVDAGLIAPSAAAPANDNSTTAPDLKVAS